MKWLWKGRITSLTSPGNWRKIEEFNHKSLVTQNEVKINRQRLKGFTVQEEAQQVKKELNAFGLVPESLLNLNLLSGSLWGFGFVILILAAFSLALWALRPIGIGWERYFIAGAISIIAALGMEALISKIKKLVHKSYYHRFVLLISLVGVCSIIAASVFLGVIRSQEMSVQSSLNRQANAVVEIQDEKTNVQGAHESASSVINAFYAKLGRLSLLAMIFIALGCELIAGVALHESVTKILPVLARYRPIKKHKRLQRQMVDIASEIEALRVEPEVARQEFYKGALQVEGLRQGLREKPGKFLIIGLAVFLVVFLVLLTSAVALAQEAVVVGIDLSRSTPEEEHLQNIKAVEDVIAKLKPGSRLIVLSVTDKSFSEPPILDARLSPDPGLFGERLKAGKTKLKNTWKEKSRSLLPEARGTDITGVLFKASLLFSENPDLSPVLIIFSDMREASSKMDLERLPRINPALVEELEKQGHIPSLENVEVFVYAVHAHGVTEAYWISLQSFWRDLFKRAGAKSVSFSINRYYDRP